MGRFLLSLGYAARDFAVLMAAAVACLAGGAAVTALLLWIAGPAGLVIGFGAMMLALWVFLLWTVWDATR